MFPMLYLKFLMVKARTVILTNNSTGQVSPCLRNLFYQHHKYNLCLPRSIKKGWRRIKKPLNAL